MIQNPRFSGATYISQENFNRHGATIQSEVQDALGHKANFSEVGDMNAVFTDDLKMEATLRRLLARRDIPYETGNATSLDEFHRGRV